MLNPYEKVSLWGQEKEQISMQCPFCGSELGGDDDIYLRDGQIIGCAWCIDCESLYDYDERRRDGQTADYRSFIFPV